MHYGMQTQFSDSSARLIFPHCNTPDLGTPIIDTSDGWARQTAVEIVPAPRTSPDEGCIWPDCTAKEEGD